LFCIQSFRVKTELDLFTKQRKVSLRRALICPNSTIYES
jgi:hypothetical protein